MVAHDFAVQREPDAANAETGIGQQQPSDAVNPREGRTPGGGPMG
jgi:hypothetical protein